MQIFLLGCDAYATHEGSISALGEMPLSKARQIVAQAKWDYLTTCRNERIAWAATAAAADQTLAADLDVNPEENMSWLKNLFGGGTKKMREAALKMGFKVEEVDRDIPIFGRRNHFDSLSRGRCVKYSLARRPNAGTGWTLLQRDKAYGSQLPNGYLATATSLTPQLIEKLRPLAIEFNEEFFEFEASDFEVSVYWEEWGGEAQVVRLHKALSAI